MKDQITLHPAKSNEAKGILTFRWSSLFNNVQIECPIEYKNKFTWIPSYQNGYAPYLQCANKKKKPEEYVKKGHVEKLLFHSIPYKDHKLKNWKFKGEERFSSITNMSLVTTVKVESLRVKIPILPNISLPLMYAIFRPKRLKLTRPSTLKEAASFLSASNILVSTSDNQSNKFDNFHHCNSTEFSTDRRIFKVRFYTSFPIKDVSGYFSNIWWKRLRLYSIRKDLQKHQHLLLMNILLIQH